MDYGSKIDKKKGPQNEHDMAKKSELKLKHKLKMDQGTNKLKLENFKGTCCTKLKAPPGGQFVAIES